MNQRREQLKKEVTATVIEGLRNAKSAGHDPWRVVGDLFPNVPESIRVEACITLDDEAEEAWWETLERTIDGEVLRKAIGGREGEAS